jgi:hypothetical protein
VQTTTGGTHLCRKSLERLGIIGEVSQDLRLQRFDCDGPIYVLVVGLIYNAYGSTPDDVFNPVFPNAIGVRLQSTPTARWNWIFRGHTHSLTTLQV